MRSSGDEKGTSQPCPPEEDARRGSCIVGALHMAWLWGEASLSWVTAVGLSGCSPNFDRGNQLETVPFFSYPVIRSKIGTLLSVSASTSIRLLNILGLNLLQLLLMSSLLQLLAFFLFLIILVLRCQESGSIIMNLWW